MIVSHLIILWVIHDYISINLNFISCPGQRPIFALHARIFWERIQNREKKRKEKKRK